MNCSEDELDVWMDIFGEVGVPMLEKAFKQHLLTKEVGKFFPKPVELFNQLDAIRIAIFSKIHEYRLEPDGSWPDGKMEYLENQLEILGRVIDQKYQEGELELDGFI